MVSKERIDELFHIDVNLGIVSRKRASGRSRPGIRAGYTDSRNGYRYICIDRVDYFEHNLIWFMCYGQWPSGNLEIDHINRVRDDNRLCNLRLATRSQNNANMKLRKDNRTGCRGVYFNSKSRKFIVQVTKEGVTKTVGRFDSLEEAAKIAKEFRKLVFGEFAHN